MKIEVKGNPGTGNTFTEINIGHVRSVLPNVTRVVNNYYFQDDGRPVQLTENLFRRLGFTKLNNKRMNGAGIVVWQSPDRRVEMRNITNSGDGYWCAHIDNCDMQTVGSCDVRYLHELQAFLNLCRYDGSLRL